MTSRFAYAAAIAAFIVGVRWGTGAAGGSDSSCYMNEARLFSRFTTHIEQPLAASAPWPRAAWTFTPAGHLPSPSRADAIVPMCPPGLPILMAVARWIHADLLVVPLLGALAVWLTFVLGRRIDSPLTGAASAVLLACSPIFLYQIVQPMTDVPAAAWWVLVAVLAIDTQGRSRQSTQNPQNPQSKQISVSSARSAFDVRTAAAGLAASMAILTRPNLLPLAIVVAIYLARLKPSSYDRSRRARALERVKESRTTQKPRNPQRKMLEVFLRVLRVLRSTSYFFTRSLAERPAASFCAGLIPGMVVLALLNWRMYGSPFASGYGSAADLFQLTNAAPNLERYVRWLWQTHTPILALALVAPFLVPRRAEAWLALALAVATIALYLPYRVFDDWWYIRFLLPAIPFLIVLSVATVARIADASNRNARQDRRAHSPSAISASSAVALGVMAAVLGPWWVYTARERHAFDLRDWERHFVDAGRFARDKLPSNAAVLTVKHSGSVHYYSQRPTVAWDTLDPSSLDRTLEFLRDRGLVPMLLLDTEEEPSFRTKFGGSSAIGRLDWPPMARVARTLRVYDPADRARYWSKSPGR
ncbi:MAG: hypothetical protein AUH43_26765 [Acidobacteria bacterium 13_1_40CM_65_14]|nr:MAG: hypothetical protein AUH43_26765 [Acidobacteria bacterium 13_1_40CM_65_14]